MLCLRMELVWLVAFSFWIPLFPHLVMELDYMYSFHTPSLTAFLGAAEKIGWFEQWQSEYIL
jgi:hypothetical protein